MSQLLFKYILINLIFVMTTSGNPAMPPLHKFQIKNKIGFAKLLSSLRRSRISGHNGNGMELNY